MDRTAVEGSLVAILGGPHQLIGERARIVLANWPYWEASLLKDRSLQQ